MTKIDKLIQKILNSKTISTDEAIKLLINLGFYNRKRIRSGSSHQVFVKNEMIISLVADRKELKPYQMQQLQEILKKEGYKND